ncbi:MAG: Jag N-terminal domain-containing protein, partial [Candidatus Desulforudis sp.]|nr:Jag N-terminal domain-containing protein [Desulforudis sp.]
MKVVEGNGRNVEEAVEEALRELGVPRDRVDVEIVAEPSRGFLGILGSRPARVRVLLRDTVTDRARELLEQIMGAIGVEAVISIEETDHEINIFLEGENLGILIGRRGETLNALQ